MTEFPFQAASPAGIQDHELTRGVLGELWARIAARLQQGEVIITSQHFLEAMDEEYASLMGGVIDAAIRRQLRRVITKVNSRYPETYVARGIQNGVDRAFEKGVHTLRWDEVKIQANGVRSIRRFTQRDRIHDLLEDVNVRPSQVDALECVTHSLQVLREETGGAPVLSQRTVPRREAPVRPTAEPVASYPPEEKLLQDPEVQAAIELADIGPDEARRRLRQQAERRSLLREGEQEKVEERLHVYVAQGVITQEEAEQIRKLRQVEQRQKKGQIDARQADNIRNSILGGKARSALEKKIDQAVDQVVNYQQVFEGMQKIQKDGDDALEFLIRHKETIVDEKSSGTALLRVIEELIDDEPLLQKLIDLADRKDHEIRMMSVRLPPYNYVMSRGMEKIGNMTIEVGFIDQLRHLSSVQISEQLNSPEPEVRVRPAADMRCLITLVDHATKRTRFRKEVRMLRLKQSIEEFYRSTTDVQEARHQAQQFLKRSLRRLFPDMPREEAMELREEGAALIDAVEKKILEERRRKLEEQRLQAEKDRSPSPTEGERELELTEDEKRMGVQIVRVLLRVAGSYRPVPQRIMPDPDDPQQYVIAVRDEETGELKPQIRRGGKRVVARDRDGLWKLA